VPAKPIKEKSIQRRQRRVFIFARIIWRQGDTIITFCKSRSRSDRSSFFWRHHSIMDVDDDDIRYELLRTLQVKHVLLLLLILTIN